MDSLHINSTCEQQIRIVFVDGTMPQRDSDKSDPPNALVELTGPQGQHYNSRSMCQGHRHKHKVKYEQHGRISLAA